ncbi:MAG: hypothetical protein M1833_002821 [Piccolia ochrophora]|nr:MAG: hypothetical protein M1833_002821 [Piccolia ochrophora]
MRLPLALAALLRLSTRVVAILPYNPTSVFSSWVDDEARVTLFLQTSDTRNSFQLLELNLSDTLDASHLSYQTLSDKLPFLDQRAEAFIPVVDQQGNINVYAGSCSSSDLASSLWTYTRSADASDGHWVERKGRVDGTFEQSVLLGANFLASGISFSSNPNATEEKRKFFVFGGMCPSETPSGDEWLSEATYSNTMLRLTSSPPEDGFIIERSQSRGPPIPEAGFSITPLQPSLLKSSGGRESQQQNFILVGGHTQSAFINMSQVALFSLPEESWSFIPADPPLGRSITDLAVRDEVPIVESRSGHSAVLTPDGNSVIIFGGWVGDVSTPAEPQLAILELGDGYGGSGNWKWTIPTPVGQSIDAESGLYGHGATMLPGGVMMIVGGFTIPSTSNSKWRREESSPRTTALFFNTTSHTWLSSYKIDAREGAMHASEDSGALSTPSQKAALGSGLAFGVAVVAGLIFVWYWYSRRLKRRREAREEELRVLGLTAHRFDVPGLGIEGFDGRREKSGLGWMEEKGHDRSGRTYPIGGDGFGGGAWKEQGMHDAERTGLLVEVPSPTRGLRKSLHSRGKSGDRLLSNQLNPSFEDGRRSMAGSIHPIDERDEYEQEAPESSIVDPEMTEVGVFSTIPRLDPFQDPQPLRSNPVHGVPIMSSNLRERELEIQQWISGWEAADRSLHSGRASPGRSSPDKDRTNSTLSERSTVSALSYLPSAGSISRSISQRSASFFGINPFGTSNPSPTYEPSSSTRTAPPTKRSQPFTLLPRPGSQDNSSSATERPGAVFPTLQTEAETLLPPPEPDSPAESPTKARSRPFGWMGSVRRALPFGGNSAPADADRSASSSPTKYTQHADEVPRRTSSTGAMYWRKKQGAADWDANARSEGSDAARESGEWDVEAAVENRVVQLMFTVPREKLRVVNASEEVEPLSEEDEEEEWEREGRGKGKEKGKGVAREVRFEEER